MSYFYLDSSALVKRYLTEIGSAWIATLADLASGNSIVVAEITRVEVSAAIAARQRAAGGISRDERDALVSLLLRHFDAEYVISPLSNLIIDQAVRLTQAHRLRGYDAVQLATALDTHATALAAGLAALTFVAADDDLLAAAHAEGLAAENPNLHP
jgi:predicted nucleic acid-binding protein